MDLSDAVNFDGTKQWSALTHDRGNGRPDPATIRHRRVAH
jgi:hypothetical protein